MAMKRVIFRGKVLNQRTVNMILRAEARLGHTLNILQGSYNRGGVSASAGTHDGGGAVDFSPTGHPREVVEQLRRSGFAAWHRLPSEGPWTEHIHAIAIKDPELSVGARAQVVQYYQGLNGLASRRRDTGPQVEPQPVWYIELKPISLNRAQNQFKADKPRKALATMRIQKLLNYRLGTHLLVDGVAGPKTKAAYKKWESHLKVDSPNSIPGPYSLRKLVKGWYRVVK